MGSIKKQPKCVKYWNMLAIKGLYLDISDWFWLFGRSKYNHLNLSFRLVATYTVMPIYLIRVRLFSNTAFEWIFEKVNKRL